MRFRAFPERVGPRILSLESVDYFQCSEKMVLHMVQMYFTYTIYTDHAM